MFETKEFMELGFRALKIVQKGKKNKGDLLIFGVEGQIGNVFSISFQ